MPHIYRDQIEYGTRICIGGEHSRHACLQYNWKSVPLTELLKRLWIAILPNFTGDIEVPSIPLSLPKEEVMKSIETITDMVTWVATCGSSPFNYALVGTIKPSCSLTTEVIESLEKMLEKLGLFMINDLHIL